MKRLVTVLVLAVLAAVQAGPAALAVPSGQGAKKAPLFQGASYNCTTGAASTDSTFGSVVMNINSNGSLVGTVSLKGAAALTTYSVFITSSDGSVLGTCPSTPHLGYLTTNRMGNGSFRLKINGVEEANNVWVILEGGGSRFQSPAVSLP